MPEGRESVFNLIENPPIPMVYSTNKLVQELGFSENADVESGICIEEDLTNFFRSTVLITEDTDAPFGGEKEDPQRESLTIPSHKLLTRDGENFFQFDLETVTIITGVTPHRTIMGLYNIFDGLPIRNVLLQNQNGNSLDVTSGFLPPRAENLLSFTGRHGGFSAERTYTFSDGRERSYPAQVFMPLITKQVNGAIEWDPQSFTYLYLHENGHAALAEKEKSSTVSNERNANAVSLAMIRRINKTFPDSGFFNAKEYQEWIEKQLKEGYDPKELPEGIGPIEYSFDDVASNERRAAIRKKLAEEKNRVA